MSESSSPLVKEIQNSIQNGFERGLSTYETESTIQRQAAEDLISFLLSHHDTPTKTILDVGCGRGYLTEHLSSVYPGAHFILNDLSPCIVEAALSNPIIHGLNTSSLIGSIEAIPLPPSDLVVSNFVFQWFQKRDDTLYHILKSTQRMAFAMPCFPTFETWNVLCKDLGYAPMNPYPTIESMQKIFHKHMFYFKIKQYDLSILNAFSFIRHLKKLGAHTRLHSTTGKRGIPPIASPITLEYHVGFFVVNSR